MEFNKLYEKINQRKLQIMSRQEMGMLFKLVERKCHRRCQSGFTAVDIGTYRGSSALVMAGGVKWRTDRGGVRIDGRVVSIDNLSKEGATFEYISEFEELSKYIDIIQGDSVEVVSQFDDASVDLILFDGSHRYEHVVESFNLYYPKVKVGGLICGHDYFPASSDGIEVIKAVEWLKSNYNVIGFGLNETLWWTLKGN